jgi:hypothetical protein
MARRGEDYGPVRLHDSSPMDPSAPEFASHLGSVISAMNRLV